MLKKPLSQPPVVVVIGAGLCGLTAAWRLQNAGMQAIILERADSAGGRTRTLRADGYVMDEGGTLFPSTYLDLHELVREAGLESELCKVEAIVANVMPGGLYRMAMRRPLRGLLQAPGLSLMDKLSLLRLLPALAKNWRGLGFADLSQVPALDNESAEEFCRKRVTPAAWKWFINPLLRAMFAENGDQVSAVVLLWVLKNFSNCEVFALRGGMQTLAQTLSAKMDVRTGQTALSVETKGERVTVRLAKGRGEGEGESELEADYCVIATDGKNLQEIYGHGLTDRQNTYLDQIDYTPLMLVAFQTSIREDIGALILQVPEEENPDLCNLMMNHQLSPDRAPDGKGLITFCGMAGWARQMQHESDENVAENVRISIEKYLPNLRSIEDSVVISRWSRGSFIGHPGDFFKLAAFVADQKQQAGAGARVFYAGDYLAQSCMNTAVATGNEVARQVLNRHLPE